MEQAGRDGNDDGADEHDEKPAQEKLRSLIKPPVGAASSSFSRQENSWCANSSFRLLLVGTHQDRTHTNCATK